MIPDYQKVMLPLLQFLGDGKPHKVNEAYSIIADYFNLTEEERNQTLPTSKKKIVGNRIQWARAYLKMAGLIENTEKFVIQITERGKQLLQRDFVSFDTQILMDLYPDFKEKIFSFRYRKKNQPLSDVESLQKISQEGFLSEVKPTKETKPAEDAPKPIVTNMLKTQAATDDILIEIKRKL